MSKYNINRIAKLFDKIVSKKSDGSGRLEKMNINIKQIVSRISFELLELNSKDILLDVGTGTGDVAISSAHICQKVIGIDISRKSLKIAETKAKQHNFNNLIFAYGSFEKPDAVLNLKTYDITKILAVYSLHHLPDKLKKRSLANLVGLLNRPGRMVIGDIMFFDDPEKYKEIFDDIGYDGGQTDFPSRVEYLTECLHNLKAKTQVVQIHPLVGIIVADFE
jgi:ubiquinone/menaquinone biosynthesis C-methylase UbiE